MKFCLAESVFLCAHFIFCGQKSAVCGHFGRRILFSVLYLQEKEQEIKNKKQRTENKEQEIKNKK